VLIAGIVVLFSGRYPRPLYDFILGMDRWVIRVAAYAALMTDRYPPFRLDLGGSDPGGVPTEPLFSPPGGATAASPAAMAPGATAVSESSAPAAPPSPGTPHASIIGPSQHRWTGGRVVALVLGALLLLTSTGLLAAGGGLLWADQTQREDGWLTSTPTSVSTGRYALVSGDVSLHAAGAGWVVDNLIGRARLQVTSADPNVRLFVGVAPARAVSTYLAGVGQRHMGAVGPGSGATGWSMGSSGGMDPGMMTDVAGGPPAAPPTTRDIWVAQTSGNGTQTLEWTPTDGNWTVVVMRADGSANVVASIAFAATVPGLAWIAAGLLAGGAVLLAVGGLLVALALRRAQAHGIPPAQAWPSSPPPLVGPSPPAPPTAEDGPVLAGTSGGFL
jgi:hypothetical protein